MLNFREITIEDRDAVSKYLAKSPSQQLINCFEAFYLWRDVYGITMAECCGYIVFRIGERCFFPMGSGDLQQVLAAIHDLKIIKATTENVALLGAGVCAQPVRDNFEYIYSASKFRDYRGAALQSKRNFVNYALKNYAWSYETVSQANIEECAVFARSFEGEGKFDSDNEALAVALRDFDRLSLAGGIIRVDGTVSALFITAPLCDGRTAAGLFLRGVHEMKGVIPLLYREFFRANAGFEYVNLAEDLGIEGLRKNKLSYDPDYLLELFDVCG